jgi:tetratricopeptide (TPR) repeat protein
LSSLIVFFSFWGIFSIDASSFKSAQHSYSRIAKIGGVEPNERSAKHWLSSLEHPWLLLIDNADDYSISIDEYFPMGERGLILVTTRNPANKVHGTLGSGFYHFEELERDEADDLLLKAACEPRPWTCSAKESAAHISKALGFLPLALVHAGKAIMSRLCSLGNYLTFYEKNWDKIRRARKVSGYRGDENVNMNVYSSYEVIYQSLEARKTEESQDAIDLLKMFSFLYCENIRVDFLLTAATNPRLEREVEETEKSKEGVEGVSKRKPWMQSLRAVGFGVLEALFRDRGRPVLPTVLRDTEALAPFDDLRLRLALRELAQMSFITHQETADSYSMHPLVHKWVRERPQMSTGEQAIWCEVASTVLAQCILLPPLGSTEADEDLRRDLLPHVLCVQKYQEDVRIRLEENQKIRRRPWPALAPRFDRRQALRSAKFSLVYTQCGLWDEAEKLQLPVKDFACSMLGIEHPATIRIMLALSVTKFHQTRFNAAAELQDQVLQACMNSLGPDHPRTLKMMDTLGLSRSFQGRFREALELHETALEGMSKTLGASHEDTLLTLDHLGRTMLNHFRYDDAKDLHSRAVAGMKDVFGPTHLNTLTAMESLAMSYLELGGELLSPAHELMTEVLELRKKKLGREHPYTLLAICNLGRIKSALNRTDEAEEIMRAALPIAERTLGENHFGTLAGRAHLANVLVRQKRYSEAEDLFTDAIQQQRYVTIARDDGEHPDRIMAMYYLLKCYQLQGKTEDAIGICDELFESISKIGGQGLGLVHPFAKRLSNTRRELQASRDASAVEPLRVPEEMEVSLT